MLKSLMRSENPKVLLTEINVTPLVDVCLVLVIIFMITTTLYLQPPFSITLPKAHTAEQTKEENIFIAIAADGRLAINERSVDQENFSEQLQAKLQSSRKKLVIIRADENALSGPVLDVLRLVKQAGARRITFGTEEKTE